MINKLKSFIRVLVKSKNPLKVIWARILLKTGLNRYFIIQRNGYKLKFSKSALATSLFANPRSRQDDEDFFKRILRAGNTYVDVGANIGTLVLSAAQCVTSSGRVVAIEAHPSTFRKLEENISLNKLTNVRSINSAAGNHKGSIFFSDVNSDDQNKVLMQQKNGISVEVNKLDELLRDLQAIDLLKLDVEGYEKFVFEGATETLQRTNVIFYESWDKHYLGFGYHSGDIIELLNRHGFDVYKMFNDSLQLLQTHYRSTNRENLVALKDAQSFSKAYHFNFVPLN